MVDFAARLFLMLEGKAFLIVDRFELPQTGRAEVRMHSFANLVADDKQGFLLAGDLEKLRIAYACDVPAVTATAVACPTKPERGVPTCCAGVLLPGLTGRSQWQRCSVPGDAPASVAVGHRRHRPALGGVRPRLAHGVIDFAAFGSMTPAAGRQHSGRGGCPSRPELFWRHDLASTSHQKPRMDWGRSVAGSGLFGCGQSAARISSCIIRRTRQIFVRRATFARSARRADFVGKIKA